MTDSGPRCRVGVDVGGTFTDFVLAGGPHAGDGGARLVYHKQASTTREPARGVAEGLLALLRKADADPGSVELVVHGTTLALNAILQRRGARVALVISQGFGDTMVLGRGGLPNSYNYKHPKQVPLVPTHMVFEAAARVAADGRVLARPGAEEIGALAAGIRAVDAETVVVVVVNAYAHPALEAELAAALSDHLPGVPVTASAQLWPEIREFERTTVCVLNGFVHPMMDRYYADLAARIADTGIAAPVHIATSNGGTVSIATARRRPVDTLLSGPASGVVAASRISGIAAEPRIVSLDMGGTSSDLAVTRDGAPEYTTETRIGHLPLVVPVVNVRAIGAGGGSIIWTDEQGVLKVGPESAGAEPGPVCYGRGGTRPTVTDCYVVSGLIDPARFLGGRMPLDGDAAERALSEVAERLRIDGADRALRAADAALRVATAHMATEISKNMAEKGLDVRDFALVPYGGAGPTHALRLADAAGIGRVIVPLAPGTFCAFGAIVSDLRRDFVRSKRLTLGFDPTAGEALRCVVQSLEREAAGWVEAEGELVRNARFEVSADMQYPRTAFELNTTIPADAWQRGDAGEIAELFHSRHERLYGFRDRDSPVDITTVRLRATAPAPKVAFPEIAAGGEPEPIGRRRVHLDGEWLDAVLHDRRELRAGNRIVGPAIVEQEDTTVWLSPGWQACVDRVGSMHATKIG
ncbi:MAG: hydantoinase/oxoprolinase family protein [Immundisolibacterales bacterium]|nr:hydantoinase/oxoprolinase family protein [Immundisolibacterales bacterium]